MKQFEFEAVEPIALRLYLNWFATKIGFGELDIIYDRETEVFIIEAETMSKDFVQAVLLKFVDRILETALFDGTPEYNEYQAKKRKKLALAELALAEKVLAEKKSDEINLTKIRKDHEKNIHFPGNGI